MGLVLHRFDATFLPGLCPGATRGNSRVGSRTVGPWPVPVTEPARWPSFSRAVAAKLDLASGPDPPVESRLEVDWVLRLRASHHGRVSRLACGLSRHDVA